MGDTYFLTTGGAGPPLSIDDSIYKLKSTSILFLGAWGSTPIKYEHAARASQEAMRYLDNIINEIMRARDQMRSDGCYAGSPLENQLDIARASSVSPVTRGQQNALSALGPGNGVLPSLGAPLSMEKLLNKIKHRRTNSMNFRIGTSGEHVFLVGADKPNHDPDSIVEFVVGEFCDHCSDIASVM